MKNEYHFKNLIIGGSIESLLYSYYNNSKILLLNPLYPFELSKLEYSSCFRSMGYDHKRPVFKSELWDRLAFIMSMTGQIAFPNIISSYRENEHEYVIVTDHNKRISITFDKLTQFDKPRDDCLNVYDWFNVRSGNNHNYNVIEDSDNFVKCVHFYTPSRVGGNKQMKDIVSESYLTKEQLTSANYTEGIVRLKTIKMMKDAGIRGQSNGYDKRGTRLHYALKIEHTHREVFFDYEPLHEIEEIISNTPLRGEAWDLTKKLFRHKQISTLRESYRLPAGL